MLISIVVPVHNEEGNVEALHRALEECLAGVDFEVIFVDDGSTDSSLEVLERLAHSHPTVRYISFSRNFGHQAALRAGLSEARGDAVISMDADLQHPPEMIPDLLARWREGYDVVYTVRDDQAAGTPWLKRATSRAFYRLLNFLTDLKVDPGAADFRLLDRKVVDLVNQQHEANLFLRGYIQWLGFKQIAISYVPAKRLSGSSSYSLRRMFSLAGSGITQFSIRPLRIAYALAAASFCLFIAYAGYAVVVTATGNAIPGWLSIVILVVVLQGIQFLLIGLVGEYLGRTFGRANPRSRRFWFRFRVCFHPSIASLTG